MANRSAKAHSGITKTIEMITKNPPEDKRSYKEQIEGHYNDAKKCIKMLRPQGIDDKLQYYVGLNLALEELRRLALGEPKLYAPLK